MHSSANARSVARTNAARVCLVGHVFAAGLLVLSIAQIAIAAPPQDGEAQPQSWLKNVDRVFGTQTLRALVHCVTFSPDGKFAVTGGSDAIQFWDVTTGELHHELGRAPSADDTNPDQMRASFHALCFSPDGKRLAGGGAQEHLAVWDVETQQQIFSRVEEGSSPRSIDLLLFSPNGEKIVTSTVTGNMAHVWNARTGEQLAALRIERNDRDCALAWSPNGKHIAVTSRGLIHLFDAQAYNEVRVIDAHGTSSIAGIGFLSDQELISGATQIAKNGQKSTAIADVKVWNVDTGELVRSLPSNGETQGFQTLCLTPDRTHFVLAGRRLIEVLRLADNKVVSRFVNFPDQYLRPRGIAISADATMVARAGGGPTLQLFDVEAEARLHFGSAGHDGFIISVSVSPDNSTLATIGQDGKVMFWETSNAKFAGAIDCGRGLIPRESAWSPDGRFLYVGGHRLIDGRNDGFLHAYDVRGKSMAFQVDVESQIVGCAVSPDGQKLAVSAGLNKFAAGEDQKTFVEILDTKTGRSLQRLSHGGSYSSMKFSADGTRLQALPLFMGDHFDVWDLKQGNLLREERLPVFGSSFLADNSSRLAAITASDKVEVFDTKRMTQLRIVQEQNRHYDNVAISADGKLLAIASVPTDPDSGLQLLEAPHKLQVWDIETRELTHVYPDLEVAIWQLQFSPDNKWLYGASPSGIALGWNLQDQ